LAEQVKRCEPCEEAPTALERLQQENEARRELLRAMGVENAAQQQFIEASAKSKTVARAAALLRQSLRDVSGDTREERLTATVSFPSLFSKIFSNDPSSVFTLAIAP